MAGLVFKKYLKRLLKVFKKDYRLINKSFPNLFLPIISSLVLISLLIILIIVVRRSNVKLGEGGNILESQEKINTEIISSSSPVLAANWASFGDNFSSQVYLDTEKTNMYWDELVTSLIFPPVYEFKQIKNCSDKDCDLNKLIYTDKTKYNKPGKIPADLKNKKIVFSRLEKLSSRKVALFVVSENNQERVYAYFLDGSKFSEIITDKTEAQIITKYGRKGGVATVGGSDDDFLIVYTGYEGAGFHYTDGKISDISRFLGLRSMDGGFSPYIIKQGSGENSLWYILSLESKKPRLIKLWQNETSDIQGAYDFSGVVKNLGESLNSFESTNKRGEINLIFSDSLGSYILNKFTDSGFDNSVDRVVTSINVNSTNRLVLKAKLSSLGLAGEARMFLGDSIDNLIEVKSGEELCFSGIDSQLLWQIYFPKSSNNEYSPWLNHVNYLDYYLAASSDIAN